MFRLTRTCIAAAVTLCAVVLGERNVASCAQGRPASRQEPEGAAEPGKLGAQDIDRKFRELQERLREIDAELRSPDRARTPQQIRAELETIAKERASLEKQRLDARMRYNRAVVQAAEDRSLVVIGTATACGVVRLMYPEFLRSLEPARAHACPPNLLYRPRGSRAGVESLVAGRIHLAVLDRPLNDEERASLKKAFPDPGTHPEEVVFCRAAMAIIAHRGNRARGLTVKQVEQVFRAEIDNWSGVGGAQRSISRIGAGYPLLSSSMFANHVLHGTPVRFPDEPKFDPNHLPSAEELDRFRAEQHSRFPGGGPFPTYEVDAKVIEEVSKNPGVIGYCSLLPSDEGVKNVRLLPISRKQGEAPVPPTIEGALCDGYPFQDQMRFLVHPDAADGTRAFVEFAASEKAAKLIKQCALWPESELAQAHGRQRVAEMQSGKGTPVAVCGLAGREDLVKALAVEYVKAKAVVQVKYEGRATVEEAEGAFREGAELMLAEGQPPSPPAPLPKGEGSNAPSPPAPLPKGEGSNAPSPPAPLPKGEGSMTPTTDHSQLTTHPLGHRAVGVIVHRDSAARELTLDDLRGIYSGQIDTWPGGSGKDAKIKLYGLPAESAVMRVLAEVVSGEWLVVSGKAEGSALTPGPSPEGRGETMRHARVTRREDTAKVVQAVANEPGALGFVDLAAMPAKEASVRLLAILPEGATGVAAPSPEKLPEGYPLAVPVTLCVHARASETAKDFAAFLAARGPEVQEALKANGIVPEPPPKVELSKQTAGRSPTESPPTGPIALGQWEEEAESGGGKAEQETLTPSPSPKGRGEKEALTPGPSPKGRGEEEASAETVGAAKADEKPTAAPSAGEAAGAGDTQVVLGVVLLAAAGAVALAVVYLLRR